MSKMTSVLFVLATFLFLGKATAFTGCPYVEAPENGQLYDYTTYYIVFCNPGFTPERYTYVNCINGQWDRPPLICTPQPDPYTCPDIDPPENGKLLHYGTYYISFCNSGYSPVGHTYVQCQNGQWDGQPPICIRNTTIMCKDLPTPANGKKACEEGPLTVGKACWFTCSDGYTLSGVNVRRCMSNLQWSSGGTTKCIQKIDRVCKDLPVPENGEKKCDEGSLSVGKACKFNCTDGYKLQGPSLRRCMVNLRWSGTAATCLPETGTACEVPPPLKNGRVLNCSPRKVPVTGQVCHFDCNKGYVLNGNNRLRCDSNGKLIDKEGKEGTFPECITESIEKQDTDNKNEEHSDSSGDQRNTTSKEENKVNRPPKQPKNPCLIDNGGCQHQCANYRGRASCRCPKGYSLETDGKSCKDIDECASETTNLCNHKCNNTEGGYTCSCFPGYIQVSAHKCEGCRKNSYWSDVENACEDCPLNSHTDSEAKTSIDACICDSGFLGDPKQSIPCKDIDECATDNFGCSHECVNLPGSAYCSCDAGYAVDKDNKTCIDMDECSIKNGGCEGECINTDGDFYCICPKGYTASNKDRYSCDDIDECLENNGGCEQKCNNFPGDYYCSCESGFRLDSQLKKCNSIGCPAVPFPHYSNTTCKKDKNTLPNSESYPIGTVCKPKCFSGYKYTATSKNIECLENGEWKGSFGECKAQQCQPLSVPENGAIHPPSCSRHGVAVKQKCTFTCSAGYNLKGKPVFTCKNNLTWSEKDIPTCEPVKIQPFISCPRDITADLLLGANTHNITVPEPSTNLGNYEISPKWVSVGKPAEFPAGKTKITFTAKKPNGNPMQCTMEIHIVDKESPVFYLCPDPIVIEGASGFGVPVSWEEPVVYDNVAVKSLTSSLEPNATLTPGTYFVEYIAKDAEGNIASCSFDINIARSHCSDLRDPAHGEANCMEWISGKLCNPVCDDEYMRNPRDPILFSCDDTGVWEPTDVISDCLKYILPVSSGCPQGFELKMDNQTAEEVCMECPKTAVWSSASRTCEET